MNCSNIPITIVRKILEFFEFFPGNIRRMGHNQRRNSYFFTHSHW